MFNTSNRLGAFSMLTLIIAGLVLLRLVATLVTPLNLGPDEAQYWRWGQSLDWGYYSKPPLIAWMIAATTSVFGDAEWAVRLYAPFGHAIAAVFLFLLGRDTFDERTGFWAALVYLLMPGVWLSSGIISTDGLLLPCWSAALFLLWRQRTSATWLQAAGLGLAIGLAFLAKYAALYLLVGIALTSIIDPATRRALLSLKSLAILAVAGALIAPNIMWNAANDFATVSHTGDNIKWEDAGLNFHHFPKFITDQMGVFGPISFLVLIAGVAFITPRTDKLSGRKDLWFLCFILPPLLAIAAQAVISRAHANWAASAYPAASVLVAAWVLRANWLRFLQIGLGINLAIGLLFTLLSTNMQLADNWGMSSGFKRARGWPETSQVLLDKAQTMGVDGIIADERETWHGLDFYTHKLENRPNLYLWRRFGYPHSYAESAAEIPDDQDATFLVAAMHFNQIARIRGDFHSLTPAGMISIPLGPDRVRELCLFEATGFTPQERTVEYEIEFRNKLESCPAS